MIPEQNFRKPYQNTMASTNEDVTFRECIGLLILTRLLRSPSAVQFSKLLRRSLTLNTFKVFLF